MSIEVIVVDNASTDRTPETLARHAGVRLLRHAQNLGFAAGCNAGMAISRGRHVLLLNPDTIVAPGALRHLLAALEKFPDVGLVGPSIANQVDGTVRSSLTEAPTLAWLFFRFTPARYLRRYRRRRWTPDADTPTSAGYLNGSCLLVRGSLLAKIGGLDDGYFLYWEDIEYSRRATASGWKLLWASAATVYHARASSTAGVEPGLRLWLNLVGARRYFGRTRRARVSVWWPLFKVSCLAGVAMTWLESGIKTKTYAIAGNTARSERHRRRRSEASAFLRKYSRTLLHL